ncbi:MAG: HupE/UreJ family protein [Gemmobacter sp.]
MSGPFARIVALSSLIAVLAAAVPGRAHEVVPAIADLAAEGGRVELSLRVIAEAHLSGIDLDGLANTNDAPAAELYDALRALEPGALALRIRGDWAAMFGGLELAADGAPLRLELAEVIVEDQPDPELARFSRVVLGATLPEGARALTLGWPRGQGALVLRQQGVAEPFTGYLEGGTQSPEIALAGGAAAQGAGAVLAEYVPVGFDHILPKGLDHILFVLGLFFLGARLSGLVWQVSAFTAAHTVTLALGVLGWVAVPGAIVEPLIAASIVFVAVENIFARGLSPWRPLVVFGFGLLHGLGFASVLADFGLPEGQVIPALIGFNIGVEVGQLTVIALAFLCMAPALGIARGAVAARGAAIGYGVAAVVLIGAGFALDGPGFAEAMGAGAPVFLWPVAGFCALCALAAARGGAPEAIHRFMRVPASGAIAAVGAFWVVERVFL